MRWTGVGRTIIYAQSRAQTVPTHRKDFFFWGGAMGLDSARPMQAFSPVRRLGVSVGGRRERISANGAEAEITGNCGRLLTNVIN